MRPQLLLALGAAFSSLALAGGSPADRLPDPVPERCIAFLPVLSDDGEMAAPEGLDYDAVTNALNSVIRTALYCKQPAGRSELHLTYELLVGCDGVVAEVHLVHDDGAPAEYTRCVADVITKADFPAHDMEDGMPVTYPVNVAW